MTILAPQSTKLKMKNKEIYTKLKKEKKYTYIDTVQGFLCLCATCIHQLPYDVQQSNVNKLFYEAFFFNCNSRSVTAYVTFSFKEPFSYFGYSNE